MKTNLIQSEVQSQTLWKSVLSYHILPRRFSILLFRKGAVIIRMYKNTRLFRLMDIVCILFLLS